MNSCFKYTTSVKDGLTKYWFFKYFSDVVSCSFYMYLHFQICLTLSIYLITLLIKFRDVSYNIYM